MASGHQKPLGAGGGDVGEPILGEQLLAAELLLVVRQRPLAGLGKLRNRPSIPPQVGGQHR